MGTQTRLSMPKEKGVQQSKGKGSSTQYKPKYNMPGQCVAP